MGRKTWVFKTNISLVVFLSFLVCLCSSIDTITFNQPLKDGDLLISNDSSYALGFFTPGNSIGKRYVGLWYLNIPEMVVVWVANRDHPVNGKSGILFIDSTGNLVIQDNKTGTSVWNTSLSFEPTGTRDYSAQLKDTGNLVLYHHDQERRVDKWQSFDYPTNTILASMKFGVDKKKSLNWFMRSWKSPDDPGTGEYTVGIDLTGKPQAFLYKNSSSRVWRVGPWNGIRWSGVPQMTPEITPYAFTENDDEFSEEYWIRDPLSVYSIVMLNDSGTLNKIMWKGSGTGEKKWDGVWYYPNDDCDYYSHCGSFGICDKAGFSCRCVSGFKPKSNQDWRQGCWRNATEVCRNGEGFLKLENMKIPDTAMTAMNTTIGLEECRELCLSNCSCSAYARANISDGGTGCITWYGDLIDMREFTLGGQDMYVRVSASDLDQLLKKSKEHNRKRLIFSVILPIAAVILVLYCLVTTNIREGKTPRPSSNTSLQLEKYMEEAGHADVLAFDLNTIRVATNNFSANNKLGEGGFGSVYKGMLQNGQFVAIKTLSRTSQQGIEEFKNEVKLIARLQHRNLVKLLGCCIQQGEKTLVYEYLPNKALDNVIFDNRQGMLLEWKKRFEIILGIAQGLLYLHQDSRLRIVHRDLKASNVLLDDSMNPKISDFGMARLFEEEQVEANTNRVVGTYGYMSPEYAMGGNFSVKSDVYSFGVLLLEIVSGKKNKHKCKETSLNLIGDVWDFWNEERALEIVDPSLGESYDYQEVLRCIHVGLLCVQLYPYDRPIMSEVIFMLSNDRELSRPNRPGFVLNKGNNAAPLSYSTSDGGNQSSNSMSITELVGR